MITDQIRCYDGSQLQDRFAYKFFKEKVKRTGDILAFVAPMCVEADFMVDHEDLENKDFIYSKKSIQFLIELPDTDLFAAVCFQRLYNTQLASLLESMLGIPSHMKGDDIMFGKGKASVSIAKEANGASLIHTAINIDAGERAPHHAYSTHLNDDQAALFMQKAIDLFYTLSQDIFVATAKIRSIV